MTEIYEDRKGLMAALASFEYQIPEGAKRVPWLERLDIVIEDSIPEDFDVDKNIDRENKFYDMTLAGVQEGLSKFNYLNIPHARPEDFMAEMIKSDQQMKKVMHKLEKDF